MSIRILLADDHAMFLQGLRGLLESEPDMKVIGESRDGREAVKAVRKLRPQVVIMDTSMPGMNGIEATEQITVEAPQTKVLCLSMHAAPRLVERAMEGGASGYLLKECAFDELVRAIREVVTDKMYLCATVAGVVVEAMKRRKPGADASKLSVLSNREREVLQLLAEGHTAKEIAERLRLSTKTIATHREHIMDKLAIHSIAGLTKYAIQEGLTSAAPREYTSPGIH